METRSPRVLIVTGEYPPRIGGVGDHVVKLRAALEELGADTHVSTESVPVDLSAERVRANSGSPWGRQLVGLLRLVFELRPDVIHIQYQSGAFDSPTQVALLLSVLRLFGFNVRIVVTFHDLGEPYLFPKAGHLRRFMVDLIRWAADMSIYVDALDRRIVCARVKGHRQRSLSIPVGPTIEPPPGLEGRLGIRARLGLGRDDFLVGFLGFRQEGKGLEVLAAALRSPGLNIQPACLVLIGAGRSKAGPRRAAVEADTALFVGLDVRDTGPLDPAAVSEWLRACDVIALPYDDGLSTRRGTFMVAVAHGGPVVTTWPSQPDLVDVKDGEVVLVPSGDSAALAGALVRIRDEPAHRDGLCQGSISVARRYSWRRIAKQTLMAYGC